MPGCSLLDACDPLRAEDGESGGASSGGASSVSSAEGGATEVSSSASTSASGGATTSGTADSSSASTGPVTCGDHLVQSSEECDSDDPECEQCQIACGASAVRFGDHCYRLRQDLGSWTASDAYCKSLPGSYELATVTSVAETVFVQSLLDASLNFAWIGANDRAHEGVFEWASGAPWSSNGVPWNPNTNSGEYDCLEIFDETHATPGWGIYTCDYPKFAVCESAPDGQL